MQRVRVCRDHDTARQVEDAPSSFPSRLSHFSEGTARLVRAEARAVAPWSLIGSSSMFNKIFLNGWPITSKSSHPRQGRPPLDDA